MENGSIAAFYEDYSLYWYGITIALSILIGVVVSMVMRALQRERINDILYIAIPSIPIGLAGARAFYCWHNNTTSLTLRQLFITETYLDGGYALYGGLGAGLIAALLICLLFKINLPKLLDSAAPGLALSIAIGRFASHFSTTDRGTAVNAKWLQRAPFSSWDPSGQEWLLNVYFFEAITAFLIFVFLSCTFLASYRFRKLYCRRGDIALAFMFMYGLTQCFFEAIRSDPLYWHSTIVSRLHFVLISQAISAVIAAISLSILILRFVYRKGINIYSVFTVILSAFSFSLIFSQEIRLPFKEESLIRVSIAQGSALLIVMGLWLFFQRPGRIHCKPAVPWLNFRFWSDRIKSIDFSS